MASAALQAFRRTVTVGWPKAAVEDARKVLIATAKAGHVEIMADYRQRTGAVPTFEAYANTPGKPVESVVIPGPIVYRYRHIGDIITFALDALVRASPIRSGRYADSHTVFVNGTQHNGKVKIGPRDSVMIANPVPYARRLEIGKTQSGRDFVLQVPNRIYERVAKRVLVPKYRNVAKITFGYVSISGAYKTKGKLSTHYGTGKAAGLRGGGTMRKRNQKAGKAIMAPAIFIEPLV